MQATIPSLEHKEEKQSWSKSKMDFSESMNKRTGVRHSTTGGSSADDNTHRRRRGSGRLRGEAAGRWAASGGIGRLDQRHELGLLHAVAVIDSWDEEEKMRQGGESEKGQRKSDGPRQ